MAALCGACGGFFWRAALVTVHLRHDFHTLIAARQALFPGLATLRPGSRGLIIETASRLFTARPIGALDTDRSQKLQVEAREMLTVQRTPWTRCVITNPSRRSARHQSRRVVTLVPSSGRLPIWFAIPRRHDPLTRDLQLQRHCSGRSFGSQADRSRDPGNSGSAYTATKPTTVTPDQNSTPITFLTFAIGHTTRRDSAQPVQKTPRHYARFPAQALSRPFSTSSGAMAAKIDGTALAKRIRERLGAEIAEKHKANPRYEPYLKIIQGMQIPSPSGIQNHSQFWDFEQWLTHHLSAVGDRSDSCSSDPELAPPRGMVVPMPKLTT